MKGNYAFIDSQNLNLSIRESGWRLDFERFRIYLKDKYQIEKAFLFIGYIPGNEVLYEKLQRDGFILIFKPTLERKGVIKGNCDAELVLHCMIEFLNFEKAIIVSNDGDFHCLIEYLIKKGKFLKLITPSTRFSSLLRKFGSYILPISRFQKKVELKKK